MSKLDYYVGCMKCKIPCEITKEGIVCPNCGDFISNEELDLDE